MLQDQRNVASYFSAVETVVNIVFTFEPKPPTTVTIAIEMPAAIMAYSMAVAPVSFARKFLNMLMTHPADLNINHPNCSSLKGEGESSLREITMLPTEAAYHSFETLKRM